MNIPGLHYTDLVRSRYSLAKSLVTTLLAIVTSLHFADAQVISPATSDRKNVAESVFVENRGQLDVSNGSGKKILFSLSDGKINLYFHSHGIFYQWVRSRSISGSSEASGEFEQNWSEGGNIDPQMTDVQEMGMDWVGANPNVQVIAEDPLEGYRNYYSDKHPEGILNVREFRRIIYKNLYPYTDVVYYMRDGHLKYDVILHPGARLSVVKFKYEGFSSLELKEGKVSLTTSLGFLTEEKPVGWNRTKDLPFEYVINSARQVSFACVDLHDTIQEETTIDPALLWGSYFGGTSVEYGYGTTIDNAGNVYMTGWVQSTNGIASAGAYQSTYGGTNDAFLIKFNSTGTRLWSTYYGGSGGDVGRDVAVDAAGNVYLVGQTASTTGIAVGSFQNSFGGSSDAFIASFNSNGARIWGSYLGGTATDVARDISFDGSNLIIAGYAGSGSGIATPGSHQTIYGGGVSDSFVASITTTGSLNWCTYLGGSGDDESWAAEVDANGNIFLSGNTTSTTSIASPGSYQSTMAGVADAFIAVFNSSGAYQGGTYFGGPNEELCRGLTLDNAGNIYISGQTTSTSGVATAGAHQVAKAGTTADYDGFLAKFNNINTRSWSTYKGGSGIDVARGLAVDATNNIYVTGNTASTSGISSQGIQNTYGGGVNDGFLCKFDSFGNLRWATYYGGAAEDFLIAGVVNKSIARGFFVGQTASTSAIATAGVHQPGFGGNWDSYIIAVDITDANMFYSRQNGNWNDINTWSNVSHSGPIAGSGLFTGSDVVIGNNHVVTLSGNQGHAGNYFGVLIQEGATFDANSFTFMMMGSITINGSFINGALAGSYQLYSDNGPIVIDNLNYGITGFPGAASTLNTDVIVLQGSQSIDGGTLNANGHDICRGYMAPPTNPVFSAPTSTSVTLSWTAGDGDAFVVARKSSNSIQPQFANLYSANAVYGTPASMLGTDNYVVYRGAGTSVTITGLEPATVYEFDLYSYNTLVGGCYSVSNYQFASFTTCAVVAAPTNPVNATYCSGMPVPQIRVDAPGSGFIINWFSDAGGTIAANGTASGSANENFTPAAAGTYYAKRVDIATGCASPVTSATLTQFAALSAGTTSANQTVCVGGDPVSITGGNATGGNGTYSYQWESASSAAGPFTLIPTAVSANYDPPSGITATTYFRRIVYSSTCSSQGAVVSVTTNAPPVITAQPQNKSICETTSTTFSVAATGASLSYQWQVNTGSGFVDVVAGPIYAGEATNTLQLNNVPLSLNNATYRCTISSLSCVLQTSPATLTINARPIAANHSVALCESTPGSGTATVNLTTYNTNVSGGVTTNAVEWYSNAALTTPVSTPLNVTASSGTVFHAKVINAASCFASGVLNITVTGAPLISPVSSKTICSGGSTNLSFTSNRSGTTYSWTTSTNASISGASSGTGTSINHTLVNSAITQQSIIYTVTPSANGCNGTSIQQTILVDPIPSAFNVTGGGIFCLGGSAIGIGLSDSQPGVTYTLIFNGSPTQTTASPGGGAFSFPGVTVSGTYTVAARTANNCNAPMTGSANITSGAAPSGGTITATTGAMCVGDGNTFTVSNVQNTPTQFDWVLPPGLAEVSRTINSITIDAASGAGGTVTVTPSNACGSGSVLTIDAVVNEAPVIQMVLPENLTVGVGAMFLVESNIPLQSTTWNFGDGQTSSEITPEIMYNAEGTYEVVLNAVATNTCIANDSKTVVVSKLELIDTFIKNVVTANGDGKNDFLYIENLDRFPENEVVLLDRWGTEIFRKKAYANDWNLKKNDQYIAAGNYVCVVKYNGKVISRTVTLLKNE